VCLLGLRSSRTGFVSFGDLAVERLHVVLDDREPETGASELAGARLVDPAKALEDAGEILGRDADAGVLNGHDDALVFSQPL